ncbi:hypothetical protein ACJJIE_04605 [Microbulbifer sp. TRSA001]|uniref:hypothetical protein n=1 Tax=Microbulbifer sp. TRSA001 TaxID=3243381 RepID=UPI004039BA75
MNESRLQQIGDLNAGFTSKVGEVHQLTKQLGAISSELNEAKQAKRRLEDTSADERQKLQAQLDSAESGRRAAESQAQKGEQRNALFREQAQNELLLFAREFGELRSQVQSESMQRKLDELETQRRVLEAKLATVEGGDS